MSLLLQCTCLTAILVPLYHGSRAIAGRESKLPRPAPAQRPAALARYRFCDFGGAVSIATLGGLDRLSQIHVESLLASHNIPACVWGEIFGDVSVPKADAKRAEKILREDAIHRHYGIVFNTGKSPHFAVAARAWQHRSLKLPWQTVVRSPDKRFPADLLAVLEYGEIVDARHRFPIVTEINYLPRQFMDTDSRLKTGYEVELELSSKKGPKIEGARYRYQLWHDGEEFTFLGGNEWGPQPWIW
jgi:hypothetical protein